MTEKADIQRLLEEGFCAAMVLLTPTEDQIRRLPNTYAESRVRVLPLAHPDGRKLMYYMKDPAAIAFAEELVAERSSVIGYDLHAYCSGVGPDTILGRSLYLDDLISGLRGLLGWDVSISDYPHTFEISFTIKGDDQTSLTKRLDDVRRVALALSLRNGLGMVVDSWSPGTRYVGQPFSFKTGLQERHIQCPTLEQLSYVERIWRDEDALAAATALQAFYSQVSDDSRISFGWAAVEQLFDRRATHLLEPSELKYLVDAVGGLDSIPVAKRNRLVDVLRDPDLVSSEGRNARIARSISIMLREPLEEVYDRVKSLARERGLRVHALSGRATLSAEHAAFIEKVLWGAITRSIDGANPFSALRPE